MSVNNNIDKFYKLRIKHSSGAELEVEGPESFILSQKEEFLLNLNKVKNTAKSRDTERTETVTEDENPWKTLTTFKKDIPYIPAKVPGLEAGQACLIIMAANRALKNSEAITAIALSKGARLSGFSPKRLDRELLVYIKGNQISAFGSKRNRKYSINKKGIEEAYLKAIEILKQLNS